MRHDKLGRQIYLAAVIGFILPPPIWLSIRLTAGIIDMSTALQMLSNPATPAISLLTLGLALFAVRRALSYLSTHRGTDDTTTQRRIVRRAASVFPLYLVASGVNITVGPALLTRTAFPDQSIPLYSGLMIGIGLIALIVLPIGIYLNVKVEQMVDWFPTENGNLTVGVGAKSALVSMGPAIIGGLLLVGFNLDVIAAEQLHPETVSHSLSGILGRNAFPLALLAAGTAFTMVQFNSAILRPVRNLVDGIQTAAKGDLTVRVTGALRDEVGIAVAAFNKMTQALGSSIRAMRELVSTVEASSQSLRSEVQSVSASVQQVRGNADRTNEEMENQAASVNETSAAIEEISSNIGSLHRAIENQVSNVTESSASIEQMISNIESITQSNAKAESAVQELLSLSDDGRSSVEEIARMVSELSSNSENLQEANKLISDISAQTNLLAMNAAIEAAHAGEAGRGFNVVASEIRKLAEAASEQSKAIAENLEKEVQVVSLAVTGSDKTASSFGSMESQIDQVNSIVVQIKEAMEEQGAGGQQIRTALSDITEITQKVREGSVEMSEGSKQVLEAVSNLSSISEQVRQAMNEISQGVSAISASMETVAQQSDFTAERLEAISRDIAVYTV